MAIPYICLFIVMILPTVLSWVGGYFRQKQYGTVDNKHPRQQYAGLQDAGARAYAAQLNAWEALPIFACSVFVAALTNAIDSKNAAIAASVFVIARVLHPIFYLADKDMLRSLAYLVGMGCAIWLFFMGA